MDDLFQLLYRSMVILKEMENLIVDGRHEVREYVRKQNELNNTLVETTRLMVFKKE